MTGLNYVNTLLKAFELRAEALFKALRAAISVLSKGVKFAYNLGNLCLHCFIEPCRELCKPSGVIGHLLGDLRYLD